MFIVIAVLFERVANKSASGGDAHPFHEACLDYFRQVAGACPEQFSVAGVWLALRSL